MKTIKKNLFGLSLGLAFAFGTILSFVPHQSEAMFFGKIPCWSAASGTTGEYTACATCAIRDGQPTGGSGKCSSGSPTIE